MAEENQESAFVAESQVHMQYARAPPSVKLADSQKKAPFRQMSNMWSSEGPV